MSREGDLLLYLRTISTKRLERRRARIQRELRSFRDLPVSDPELERRRDEVALITRILDDRAS